MFDNTTIINLLSQEDTLDYTEFRRILTKSLQGKNLELPEINQLLQIEHPELLGEMFSAAKKVKEMIYGKRVVMFAPLYLTSFCENDCTYCGFRRSNTEVLRKELTVEETLEEAKHLENKGQKRILLVAGESSSPSAVEKTVETIKSIYKNTGIKGINLNMAPLRIEDYARLKDSGLGVYTLFQETYHSPTYEEVHPSGPKNNYKWRYEAPFRAIQGGVHDIGMGVLFGLYDYKYEILALFSHIREMESRYGVGPHTLSIPRIRPAEGASFAGTDYRISDLVFKKIVAVLRLALPYVGIILSTREPLKLRQELLDLGVSQMSAGSCTSPGGYGKSEDQGEQFSTEDIRPLEDVMEDLLERGYLPNFCTACFTQDRSGSEFISLAQSEMMKNKCEINALISLKQLLEHSDNLSLKTQGESILREEINKLDVSDKFLLQKAIQDRYPGNSDIWV